jgi:hypothetical protein
LEPLSPDHFILHSLATVSKLTPSVTEETMTGN